MSEEWIHSICKLKKRILHYVYTITVGEAVKHRKRNQLDCASVSGTKINLTSHTHRTGRSIKMQLEISVAGALRHYIHPITSQIHRHRKKQPHLQHSTGATSLNRVSRVELKQLVFLEKRTKVKSGPKNLGHFFSPNKRRLLHKFKELVYKNWFVAHSDHYYGIYERGSNLTSK